KMTSFHAGGKSLNIIPGSASFSLDVRAQTNEGLDLIINKVYKIAEMLSEYHQIKIDLQKDTHIAAAIMNDGAINIMKKAIVETVGENKLCPTGSTTAGDDCRFYTIHRPEIKAPMIGIGCDLSPGLHHPNMTFDFSVIPQGVEILAT